MIGREDRAALLRIARASIGAMLDAASYTAPVPGGGPLGEPRGAFVTLRLGGRLRGCIGRIVSEAPLAEVVAEMAVAAARDDYRFNPLARGDLEAIRIEISALGPLRTVTDPGEIAVGRDGLLVRKGRSSGLLLPQVAAEEGWGVRRFLDETCRKAGLPEGAWKEGASIEAFEAEVWGEEE